MMSNLNALLKSLPPRQALALALTELNKRQRENRLASYQPYPKQREFHRAGKNVGQRLFMAANQVGKTIAGGAELAIHLTGRYPDWWDGAVFEKPIRAWCGGVTSESTRDNPQRILVGQPEIREQWGTGMVPKECLLDTTSSRGTPNGLDSIVVRWGGGGDIQAKDSSLLFKSYEKGREKWQGDTIDVLWCDEEPPPDIYSEGKTRTNNGQLSNFVFVTFTPLLGMSEVVRQFLSEDEMKNG
jgi:phage terminase large subunit-like protein